MAADGKQGPSHHGGRKRGRAGHHGDDEGYDGDGAAGSPPILSGEPGRISFCVAAVVVSLGLSSVFRQDLSVVEQGGHGGG